MRRYVYGLLRRYSSGRPDPGEAEDIVQAYLLRAMEKSWLSDGPSKIRVFRAWLQTQLRRFTLDQLRAKNTLKTGAAFATTKAPLSAFQAVTSTPPSSSWIVVSWR